jgi:hypothetical protein
MWNIPAILSRILPHYRTPVMTKSRHGPSLIRKKPCHRGRAPISGGGEDQGNIDVALVI